MAIDSDSPAAAGPGPAGRDIEAQSVGAFLDALASGVPSPGGGSAAALAGALAAALVAMSSRVTADRDPAATDLAEAATAADQLRRRLTALAGADAEAYEALLAARRLPPASRAAAAQTALRRATDVPLDLVAAARDTLAMCERIVRRVRSSTLSDLQVANALAVAALEAGAVTAQTNLRDSTDREFAGTARRELDQRVAEGRALAKQVVNAAADRVGRVD
jgi:formiminotetrahydrofolate cyclodeaminase